MRLSDAAKAVGGTLYGEDTEVYGITTDSRKVDKGDLFVAISGEKFDAHDFIAGAGEKGAAAAIAQKASEAYPIPYILVEDSVKALGLLAGVYRKRFSIPVVGITGSVGKTTTKEFVYAVLSSAYKTHKTEGNFNNHIGLPLTVLSLGKTDQAAIFEMGMSHFGEISYLTRIARPDIALITNIGVSHMENLGSKEGILKAKLEIEEGLSPTGSLVLNADDPLLWSIKDTREHEIHYYGCENKQADLFVTILSQTADQMELCFDYKGERQKGIVKEVGAHNAQNAAAAVLTGLLLGIPLKKAVSALARFKNAKWRQHIERKNGVTVIEDFYNASPDAMAASLRVLGQIEKGTRKVAILADMLELGKKSEEFHFMCGEEAAKVCDLLIVMGEHAKNYLAGAKNAGMDESSLIYAPTLPLLKETIRANIKNADTVLIKGSRGMHLEQIVDDVYTSEK